MGMDLHGRQGYFRFTLYGWDRVLKLALLYGWQPLGTALNRRQARRYAEKVCKTPEQVSQMISRLALEYHGAYCFNEGQYVTARDAKNMAAALERALPDIPQQDIYKRKWREMRRQCKETGRQPTRRQLQSLSPLTRQGAIEMFSGRRGKQVLREFIGFCRKGRFRIC